MGPMIDPKMRTLQEVIVFLQKNSYIYIEYDRVIKHNTPKCVENCSDY